MVIDILTSQLHLAADLASDVQNSDLFVTLIQIAAYVTPYFLIPATFKFGLGVFGNLAGMVNDRSRGIFDRQKKYRQAKQAQNWSDFKSGTGKGFGNWRQSAPVRRIGTSIGSGWEGRYGFGERGAQARSQIAGLAAQEGVMKHPRWSQINENDDALHALTYSSRREAVAALSQRQGWNQDRAERAAAAAYASVGYGRSQAIAAAQQLATTGTGYNDLDDQIQTIARASGGDVNTSNAIAGYNNFINKQKGRHDLAPGAVALMGAVEAEINGGGITNERRAQLHEAAWNSGGLYQVANGKGAATRNMTNHWVGQLAQGMHSGDAAQVERSVTALKEMKAMLPNASGDNQLILNESIERMEAMIEDDVRTVPGYVAPGTAGPKTQAQVQREEAWAQIHAGAERRARTYERPDPNRLANP